MRTIWEKWKTKWNVETDQRMLWIFLIFAITGSATVFVRKGIFKLFDISFDNSILQFTVRILAIYIVYQIMLMIVGSIMGEYKFVLWFLKKMNKRIIPKSKRN